MNVSPELKTGEESILTVTAFLLDTYIENPEGVLIVQGGKEVLFSELIADNPEKLTEIIEARAATYKQLGWEVPDAQ